MASSLRNLVIKSNPMNIPKKQGGEEKKRGHKTHKQVLEETRSLLIYSGQVVGLPDKYFLPQTNS
jgi:hypothetical protein